MAVPGQQRRAVIPAALLFDPLVQAMTGEAYDSAQLDMRQLAAADQLVHVVFVDAQQLGGFSDG